jgi:hypothetical protein
MHNRIAALDDESAVAVLTAFVHSLRGPKPAVSALTSDMQEALRLAVPGQPQGTSGVADGELARTALLVLSEEPKNRRQLERLLDASELEALGLLESVGLATLVLVVLQTRARFERDKRGKVHLLFEKRPTKAGLIEPLIQKLLAWSSVGSSGQQ